MIPTSELKLVRDLLRHAVRLRPSIVLISMFGLFSAGIELAAIMSVVPLGILAGGKPIPAHSFWLVFPRWLGFTPDAKFFVLMFLALFLARMASFTSAQVMYSYIMQNLVADFSSSAYSAFIRRLSFTDIFRHQIGYYVSLAGDEANRGAQIVVGVMKLAPVIFLFLLYAIIIFLQSWMAGLGLITLIAVVVLSLRKTFAKSLALGQRQQEESRICNTHFIETLSSLRTIRSFTAEDFAAAHFLALMRKYTWTLFLSEALTQAAQLPAILVIAAILCWAAYVDAATLQTSLPLILAGIMMFIRLMPMANLGLDIALRLTTNLRAGGNVAEMLKAATDNGHDELLPSLPPDARIETIEFDNVNFAYGSTANLVFRNFSSVLRAGRSYAVIGSSGAGKSTLVDLLLKFFAPQSGTIRVNGQDIALLSAKALRARMVLAEQTTHIFHGTVTENVKLGEKADDEEAHKALDFVGLQDLLDSLPNGADTLLTFRGSNFSGGQRQRVGIARALMRTADVLILDESTNALDSQTRERILDRLFSLYRDRILIFVTHDMHIVGRVDEVIDLDGGQTLEERRPADPLPAPMAQEQGASIS